MGVGELEGSVGRGGGKGEGSARVTGAILITHGEVPKPPALAVVYLMVLF